jgi:hypothetical protein
MALSYHSIFVFLSQKPRNSSIGWGLSYLDWQSCQPLFNSKGECEMSLPKTISGWCMWLYFLWVGISAFVALPMAGVIAGVLALGYAIFALLGR